jgi:hypothetical protein
MKLVCVKRALIERLATWWRGGVAVSGGGRCEEERIRREDRGRRDGEWSGGSWIDGVLEER